MVRSEVEMFNKYVLGVLALLFIASGQSIANSELAHLYCQQIRDDGALLNRVLVLTQESASDQVSAADLVGAGAEAATSAVRFNMRIYNGVTIATNTVAVRNQFNASQAEGGSGAAGLGEWYDSEVVRELLKAESGLYGGVLEMGFTGLGHRDGDTLVYNTTGPYQFVKTFAIGDFSDSGNLSGALSTGDWKTVVEDGLYACSMPALISGE